jgi:hypothetical protein
MNSFWNNATKASIYINPKYKCKIEHKDLCSPSEGTEWPPATQEEFSHAEPQAEAHRQ